MNQNQPQPAQPAADPQAQSQHQQQGAPRRRVYLGRPENRKDPQAVMAQPPRNPPLTGARRKLALPAALNKPTNLPSADRLAAVQMNAEDPAKHTVFATGINVREVNNDTKVYPSAPAAIEISRITFREMITDDPHIQKSMTPEYLDYYTTAMIWCRLVTLKKAYNEVLTQEEEQLVRILENVNFSVPEPILSQLKIFGRTQTLTREHLRPQFPDLPTEVIRGFGGYFGAISSENHNNYEELPCPGVLAEAVRQTVSDAGPGSYISSLQREGSIPNANLLGFRPAKGWHWITIMGGNS